MLEIKMDTSADFVNRVYKSLVPQSQLVQQISVELTKAAKSCGGLGGTSQSAWLLDTTSLYIQVALRVDQPSLVSARDADPPLHCRKLLRMPRFALLSVSFTIMITCNYVTTDKI